MEQNQTSLTAKLTAYVRAHHALHDQPKIFNDFLARQFLSAEEYDEIGRNLTQLAPMIDPQKAAEFTDVTAKVGWVIRQLMSTTLSRSRYAEDRLEAELTRGVRQYVILSAGLDTFGFRRPELLKRLQVFEVDHPATQTWKLNRLQELQWPIPAALRFVAVDLLRDDLAAKLTGAGYDQEERTFVSWLGGTMYLSRTAVLETLRTLTALAPSGSTILFDYMERDAYLPERAGRSVLLTHQILEHISEPWLLGFEPSSLADELAAVGLRLEEDLDPDRIEARYYANRSDGYHASEHLHYACAVVP